MQASAQEAQARAQVKLAQTVQNGQVMPNLLHFAENGGISDIAQGVGDVADVASKIFNMF